MLKPIKYEQQYFADKALIDLCELRRFVFRQGKANRKTMFQVINKMQEYHKKMIDMDSIEHHSDEQLLERIQELEVAIKRNALNDQNLTLLRENKKLLDNEYDKRIKFRST